MLKLIAVFALCCAAVADEPQSEVEKLKAENAQLKAQIQQILKAYAYDSNLCAATLEAARKFVLPPQEQLKANKKEGE